MDALLLAFVACAAVEMGDRGQLLAVTLNARFPSNIASLIWGCLMAAAIAGVIGWQFASTMEHSLEGKARTLFMAVSFLLAGIGMARLPSPPKRLARISLGPFAASAIGMTICQIIATPVFLMCAIGIGRGDSLLAGVGGALGICAALMPFLTGGVSRFSAWPMRWIRRTAAVLFFGIGALIAVHIFYGPT